MTMRKVHTMTRLAPALIAASVLAGCATAPMAMAQPPISPGPGTPPVSTIQPETTITLTGTLSSNGQVAWVCGGTILSKYRPASCR